jgi:pteridine reductase
MPAQKVALITGSGKRRIGRHVADALAERGYAIALHYFQSKNDADEAIALYESRDVPAIALQANLADEVAVQSLINRTLENWGRLDVLVNCAADWQRKKLEEITASDVRHFFEVNTLGTFLCSQLAGLAITNQKEGVSIIPGGDWATARPYLDYAAYMISKGSIPAMTRTLAVELASRNPRVRVNCLMPGPVMLPSELPESERREAIQGTLVKHEGTPENLAQAVMFLVENPFVNGVCLPIDGGRTIA